MEDVISGDGAQPSADDQRQDGHRERPLRRRAQRPRPRRLGPGRRQAGAPGDRMRACAANQRPMIGVRYAGCDAGTGEPHERSEGVTMRRLAAGEKSPTISVYAIDQVDFD
jgi:hypothetical protein